jgi:glutathione S-transferase
MLEECRRRTRCMRSTSAPASSSSPFLPTTTRGKYQVMQWLMWQMGGFGPMLGQSHHFRV